MRRTVRLAKHNGVKVGAHPSLPDLQGFGRREMKIGREELANCLIYQIGALKAFLDAEGMQLNHIKPHGSLYGMAARSEETAHAICDAADVFNVPILGMVGTLHETIYEQRGHVFLSEYYTDLDYGDDGQLVITREHKEVDPAEAVARCLRAIRENLTRSLGGKDVQSARRHHLRPLGYAERRRHCDGGAGCGGTIFVRGLSDRSATAGQSRLVRDSPATSSCSQKRKCP